MRNRLLETTIVFLLITVSISGQIISSFNAGGTIHIGSIAGNSPSVTSGGGSLFFDFYPWFEHDVSFRTSILYSQKIEKFLPGNNIDMTYPFIKSFSLKGFIRQDFSCQLGADAGDFLQHFQRLQAAIHGLVKRQQRHPAASCSTSSPKRAAR